VERHASRPSGAGLVAQPLPAIVRLSRPARRGEIMAIIDASEEPGFPNHPNEALWLIADIVAVLMEQAASGTITTVGAETVDTASARLQQMAHHAGQHGVQQRLATARGQFRHRYGRGA
jgi:hypothetical protein